MEEAHAVEVRVDRDSAHSIPRSCLGDEQVPDGGVELRRATDGERLFVSCGRPVCPESLGQPCDQVGDVGRGCGERHGNRVVTEEIGWALHASEVGDAWHLDAGRPDEESDVARGFLRATGPTPGEECDNEYCWYDLHFSESNASLTGLASHASTVQGDVRSVSLFLLGLFLLWSSLWFRMGHTYFAHVVSNKGVHQVDNMEVHCLAVEHELRELIIPQ